MKHILNDTMHNSIDISIVTGQALSTLVTN